MSATETTDYTTQSLTWNQICALYPHEWVCLNDIVRDDEGTLQAARVIAHHRSIARALEQIEPSNPSSGIIHTAGVSLRRQRYKVASDEGRDPI